MVKRDFRTPPTTPVETQKRCITIPASQPWLGLVNAALLMLTEAWRYEQVESTDLTPDETAARAMEMYVAYLGACEADMNCNDIMACMLPLLQGEAVYDGVVRLDPVTDVPQVSYDGGVTWTDIPPSAAGPLTPTLTVTPGNNDAERMCLAATRAAIVISQFYEQTFGAFTAGAMNTLNSINQFLHSVNMGLFNLLYSPYEGVLEASGWFDYDFSTNFTAAALDATAYDALVCLLLNNASVSDGVVTFDYGAVFANVINDLGANPGTAVTLLLSNMQASGLNAAGNVAATDAGDCGHCEDIECASYTDTLTTELGPQTYLLPALGFNNAWGGTVTSGAYNVSGGRSGGGVIQGVGIGTYSGASRVIAEAMVDLGRECTVNSTSIWHRQFRNIGEPTSAHIIYYDAAGVPVATVTTGILNESTAWRNFANITPVAGVRFIRMYTGVVNPAVTTTYLDDINIVVAT